GKDDFKSRNAVMNSLYYNRRRGGSVFRQFQGIVSITKIHSSHFDGIAAGPHYWWNPHPTKFLEWCLIGRRADVLALPHRRFARDGSCEAETVLEELGFAVGVGHFDGKSRKIASLLFIKIECYQDRTVATINFKGNASIVAGGGVV